MSGDLTIRGRGLGLLVAAIALFGAGLGLGYPELAVLGTASAVAMVFAAGYVAWRPRLAVMRIADPDRVTRGESSGVTLTVSNASRLRAATLMAYDRCGHDDVAVPLLRLRAGRETTVRYPVPTGRRGVVPVGPLRVIRRDPLGLLTMARSNGPVDRVWVYPKLHPLTAVPAGVVRSLDGLVDRVPHGSITFDTLREYVIGDELRHVHWRTSARVGELMVREHLDTSLPRLVIVLDDRAEAYPPHGELCEPFEAACEAAASILVAALREDLPVALRLVTGVTIGSVPRGGGQTRQYLDALAEARLEPPPPSRRRSAGTGVPRPPAGAAPDRLDPVVSELRHRRLGDTLIFLTGPGDTGDIGRVGTLRGEYQSVVVGLLGAADTAPPLVEGVLILPASDGAQFAAAWNGARL